jgi:hypothetical protein
MKMPKDTLVVKEKAEKVKKAEKAVPTFQFQSRAAPVLVLVLSSRSRRHGPREFCMKAFRKHLWDLLQLRIALMQ